MKSFPRAFPPLYSRGVTVLEVIQRSTEYLAGKGVESPRRNVEEMLAQVLKLPRLELYLKFERLLSPAELDVLRVMVKRRGRREPLQHILGSVSFCGLEMVVSRDALVPRPETELLAELACQFLSGLKLYPPTALDFGTGTGCLAIALAVKVAEAQIQALDISQAAIDLARQNAAAHQVNDRVQFRCGDGLAAVPAELRFDLIVANPPYVPSGEIAGLQPEVCQFDPCLALDGGPDGLDFYRQLAGLAAPRLKPGGKVMLEFGDGQGEAVRTILSAQNWVVEALVQDYSRRPRICVARPG
jgi:release factor glutamine methyltransferase